MNERIIIAVFFFCLPFLGNAQIPAPGYSSGLNVLLLNATAHLGNGKLIDKSAIAFKDGIITKVEDASKFDQSIEVFDTVIDLTDNHIYPGIIAPNSTLGLFEIGAVRATKDFREVGSINPNVRSIIAYNTDSRITPTVRSNGVLLAQITPRGGLVSGTSSVVELDAWNWEDAVCKLDDGIHINWPVTRGGSSIWKKGGDKNTKRTSLNIARLHSLFSKARAYSQLTKHKEFDVKMESMRGLFSAKQSLFIHVNKAEGIAEALSFGKEYGIEKIVLVGVAEGWLVLDLIKESGASVMLKRLHSLPTKMDEDIDLPYRLPKLFLDAGILYCLENSGDMEAMGTRNLPFYAGTAAAYGLTKEEALMSITSNTAKILGLENRLGSLEVGKDATLFVSRGDALDMLTNHVVLAYVRGRQIDLNNPQKSLYRKFRKKYRDISN